MKTCLILVFCLASVYCADWNKFREGTQTELKLLEERLKSLTNHAEKLIKKPEKEAIETVLNNVKDEIGHVDELDKKIKAENVKNYTLISQVFFLEKSITTINLIKAELKQLQKALSDVENTTSTFYAATEAPVDYRQLYDHLLMESINEKIRSGERFLEKVSHELLEFQRTHNETLHSQLVREVNFALQMIKSIEPHFDDELKKTGLNAFERFFIEKEKSEALLMIKALTTVQNAVAVHTGPKVTKMPVFFAPTEAPTDWRQAYDQLLFSFIDEHIRRADGFLLQLQRMLNDYQKTKDKELRDRIIRDVEREIPMLKATQEQAVRELKRTDLNHIESFLYQKSNDQIGLLIKHFTQIETAVKKPL